MNRRRFTLSSIGAAIGGFFAHVRDAMATPPPVLFDLPTPKPKHPEYYMKVGRRLMVWSADDRCWEIYATEPGQTVPSLRPDVKRWIEDSFKGDWRAPSRIEQYPTYGRAAAEDFAIAPSDYAVEAARIVHSRPPVELRMCDGHNGPSPTRLTEMLDGRRLCEYCRKQHTEEQEHGSS